MGLFLCLSGVIGKNRESVTEVISAYFETRNGTFKHRANDASEDRYVLSIGEGAGNTTVLFPPYHFTECNEASRFISKGLTTPVFSFHIHDGDLWMFTAYQAGVEVAWFNPIPDYWGEIDATDEVKWAGNALDICRLIPDVSVEQIEKYFVRWSIDGDTPTDKAYSDDEYSYGADWQLTDFMRRIGLKYPMSSDSCVEFIFEAS